MKSDQNRKHMRYGYTRISIQTVMLLYQKTVPHKFSLNQNLIGDSWVFKVHLKKSIFVELQCIILCDLQYFVFLRILCNMTRRLENHEKTQCKKRFNHILFTPPPPHFGACGVEEIRIIISILHYILLN